MSETTEEKPVKKAPAKKAAPKEKVPMRAKGKFADGFEDDGYEIGYLEIQALHQWNKNNDIRITVEHPQHGKPTFVILKPGQKNKVWKRVYNRFQNEYHKLTTSLDENGNPVENEEKGYMTTWTPIYEGEE